MKAWKDRPTEVANLLNPAFCGMIIHEFCFGYQQASQQQTPYALLFLPLPMTLLASTRETIKPTVRQLQTWVLANPTVRIDLARCTRELAPFTREALMFLAARSLLKITAQGAVDVGGRLSGISASTFNRGERKDILAAAGRLARLTATAGPPEAVFGLLGLRP